MVEDFENSGHPVFQGMSPLGRGILKKKNNRDTIHFNVEYCNIDVLYKTVHSANPVREDMKVLAKTPREIQIKQEDLKSLVDIPRQPQASGNRMHQNWKDFNSMPFVSKIEFRTTAKFNHSVEKGNHYTTTNLEDDGWGKRTSMCKEYTAPRNREDSRPYASTDPNQ